VLAVTGLLIGIVVPLHKSKSVPFQVKTKIGVTSSPSTKDVPISEQDSDAYESLEIKNGLPFMRFQPTSYRDVNRQSDMVGVEGARCWMNNMIGTSRKVRSWRWQQFYPRFISAVVSGSATNVSYHDVDSGGIAKYFFSRIPRRFCRKLRSVTHSDLVLDGAPLQASYNDVNRIDHYRSNSHYQRLVWSRIALGIGLLALGFVALVWVGDDLCDGQRGIIQVAGIAFCLVAFILGQLLVIWNLALIVAQNS